MIKQIISNTLTRKAAAESQELIRLRWQKAMLERAIAEKEEVERGRNDEIRCHMHVPEVKNFSESKRHLEIQYF